MRTLGAGADIFGFDIYPVRERADHSGLPNRPLEVVGEQTDRARRFAPSGAEVRMIVQAFGYSDLPNEGGRGRRPTPEELRFMAYDAVAHGADGVAFFGSHQLRNLIPLDAPVWRLGVGIITRELALVGPRLHEDAPFNGLTAQPDSVVVRAVRSEQGELVVAVNEADVAVAGTLQFDRALSGAWEIFQERPVAFEGSELHDDFTPYGVHVYRVGR